MGADGMKSVLDCQGEFIQLFLSKSTVEIDMLHVNQERTAYFSSVLFVGDKNKVAILLIEIY